MKCVITLMADHICEAVSVQTGRQTNTERHKNTVRHIQINTQTYGHTYSGGT